jgi:hypothetical protein
MNRVLERSVAIIPQHRDAISRTDHEIRLSLTAEFYDRNRIGLASL